jgi:RNA polymerase-binding protein DksA
VIDGHPPLPHRPCQPPATGRSDQRQQRSPIQLKLKQTDAKILQAIEEALLRLEKGTYGICRDCGEPIARARLEAIPWTRVCITCKQKQNP